MTSELETVKQWKLQKFDSSTEVTSIRSIVFVPKLSEVIVFARGHIKSSITLLIRLQISKGEIISVTEDKIDFHPFCRYFERPLV